MISGEFLIGLIVGLAAMPFFLVLWLITLFLFTQLLILFGYARRLSPRHVRLSFIVGGKKVTHMFLKASQKLPVTLLAEDAFQNPGAALDAPPAWALTDPTLGSVVAADDGMSAVVTPSGKLGDCQVQVTAVADGKTVAGALDLSIIPGDATQLVISAGTPVDA